MNRRGFLKRLAVAPVVAPLVLKSWPEAQASPVVEPAILSKEEAQREKPWVPTVTAPPGTILGYVGQPPEGYLPCDGRLVSVKEYPALYKAIGQTWGVSEITQEFRLPALNTRVIAVGPNTHSHNINPTPSPSTGNINTASSGWATSAARSDHVHTMMVHYDTFGYMIKT